MPEILGVFVDAFSIEFAVALEITSDVPSLTADVLDQFLGHTNCRIAHTLASLWARAGAMLPIFDGRYGIGCEMECVLLLVVSD